MDLPDNLFPFDLSKLPPVLNTTVIPYNVNTTGLYTEFLNIINSTTWANLQPQNIHERADDIFNQPENIISLILCFLALAVNVISISATAHIPHGLTHHSKLIISLAASDILVTLSVFMHILIKVLVAPVIPPTVDKMAERLTSACMFQFVNSINITAHLISLLNLFAMALDHYISVMQPLHYFHIMNSFRGNLMITVLWVIALIGGFSNFFAGFGKTAEDSFMNFCEYTLYTEYQAEYIVIIMALVCLISILVIYIRIYREVKQINAKCVNLLEDGLHNRKAFRTTLLIIGTFVICWLPSMTFQIAMIIQVHVNTESVRKLFTTLIRANKYLYALLLVNSLCDPIIYAVRLKEVQHGYFRLLSRCSKFYREKVKEELYNQSRAVFNSRRRSTEYTIKFLLTDCNLNQSSAGLHRNLSAPLLFDHSNGDQCLLKHTMTSPSLEVASECGSHELKPLCSHNQESVDVDCVSQTPISLTMKNDVELARPISRSNSCAVITATDNMNNSETLTAMCMSRSSDSCTVTTAKNEVNRQESSTTIPISWSKSCVLVTHDTDVDPQATSTV